MQIYKHFPKSIKRCQMKRVKQIKDIFYCPNSEIPSGDIGAAFPKHASAQQSLLKEALRGEEELCVTQC